MRHGWAGGKEFWSKYRHSTNTPVLEAWGHGRLNRTASVMYPWASALAAVPFPGYSTRSGQFSSQSVTVMLPVRPATSHNSRLARYAQSAARGLPWTTD